MKLLHLSDLHIGKRVNGFSMLEDQRFILDQLQQLAVTESVDGILLAGDLYDKPIPPAEAVSLLDSFLTGLARNHIPVFAISGNHDSPERLNFGSSLMEGNGIHLTTIYHGAEAPYVLRDAWGEVHIYLLPFLKPALVRHVFPESHVTTYEKAVAYALAQWNLDSSARNILVAHQFVSGGTVCDSEERSVGGLDQVSAQCFDAFDYVALGHLHGPQKIQRETLRYCGTPLKYSFSECHHNKSATLVHLDKKGDLSIETRPLHPLRDLREIKGSYDQITARSFYQDQNLQDYLHIILTVEEDVPEALGKLRTIYPNIMKLTYDNQRTRTNQEISATEAPEKQSPLALFQSFYEQQNNQPMHEEQVQLLTNLIESIWEEEA